jgi:hypothetical protein
MNWARQTTTRVAHRFGETEREAECMLRMVPSTGVATSVKNRSGGGSQIRLATDVRIAPRKED